MRTVTHSPVVVYLFPPGCLHVYIQKIMSSLLRAFMRTSAKQSRIHSPFQLSDAKPTMFTFLAYQNHHINTHKSTKQSLLHLITFCSTDPRSPEGPRTQDSASEEGNSTGFGNKSSGHGDPGDKSSRQGDSHWKGHSTPDTGNGQPKVKDPNQDWIWRPGARSASRTNKLFLEGGPASGEVPLEILPQNEDAVNSFILVYDRPG